MKPTTLAAIAVVVIAAFGVGAYVMNEARRGPAEEAGAALDEAAESLSNALE